ncbi:MAG: UDP-N-acetylmuramate dehydrogenase [Luteimonas sp.]
MSQGYRLVEDADLGGRNTFGVPARAALLAEVLDTEALPELLLHPGFRNGPALVLGGGSNLLFAGDVDGTVLALRSQRIAISAERDGDAIVRADAGVDWDACVRWTLAQGLCGLENLALIPGTVGAAPIQNIGAYGVEVGDRIEAVEAWDLSSGQLRRLVPRDCAFAYRDSRFKHEPGRWIVTAVEFSLSRSPVLRLDYVGIADELAAMGVVSPDAVQVAEAVTRIRRRKLPDPAVIGNAGSVFKNPIVAAAVADALHTDHPKMPIYPVSPFPAAAILGATTPDSAIPGRASLTGRSKPQRAMPAERASSPTDAALHDEPGTGGRRKLSAAWLIDACGWKGHRDGDAGVSAEHALVLVNHGKATGPQLLDLARRIAASVDARFDVALESEPRIIGAEW